MLVNETSPTVHEDPRLTVAEPAPPKVATSVFPVLAPETPGVRPLLQFVAVPQSLVEVVAPVPPQVWLAACVGLSVRSRANRAPQGIAAPKRRR